MSCFFFSLPDSVEGGLLRHVQLLYFSYGQEEKGTRWITDTTDNHDDGDDDMTMSTTILLMIMIMTVTVLMVSLYVCVDMEDDLRDSCKATPGLPAQHV